ncbi:hypothetical protein [Psychromonas sp. MME2]|uniref:hypothetical protein n=1 Tax=unclassified Psychromonas TaxID=2614957 RepID=UPI00339BBB34
MKKFIFITTLSLFLSACAGKPDPVVMAMKSNKKAGVVDISLLQSNRIESSNKAVHTPTLVPAICEYTENKFKKNPVIPLGLKFTAILIPQAYRDWEWIESPLSISYSAYSFSNNAYTTFKIYLKNNSASIFNENKCTFYSKTALKGGGYYKEILNEVGNLTTTLESIGVEHERDFLSIIKDEPSSI